MDGLNLRDSPGLSSQVSKLSKENSFIFEAVAKKERQYQLRCEESSMVHPWGMPQVGIPSATRC
ncbi:hypothetical protein DPMN_162291 [Dreissena polymorpha]|uniref:Uncharacterized protein n=1 Tax=Dreissena polymorpha TaxID=45954 RepID=A0A9D4EUT7_DREPO|nr:hypothetical protein DPMN_162291 [Dreissena polymorpha]